MYWYDDTGNYSRARLNVFLENDWVVRIRQKLARINNDPDNSGIDELFLERASEWRLGKQYLPYGSNRILKENGWSVRFDTELAFADLPLVIAFTTNGKGRQQGVVLRIGDWFGISAAIGSHFGINATSFTQLQLPEEALGIGRGYRFIYGIDFTRKIRALQISGEYLQMRRPHTFLDREDDILNLLVRYEFPFGPALEAEGTLATESKRENLKISSQIPLSRELFLVPMAIFRKRTGMIYGISAQVRL